jgi:pyrimidine-nucleoside phosphorylase
VTLRPQDAIRIKRDGGTLSEDMIREVIAGVVDGSIADYQLAALLMAVFLRGMTSVETLAWTHAMVHSGTVIDLSSIPGAKVDKHSTGGVGDKISICLAPLVAACDVFVPMISGRGLGHTGGTLDKLESIAGFDVHLDARRLVQIVTRAGLVLAGQSDELAPADRRLYALRDVTSTVESIPLIASSIMSKKLAAGIDALVLDVKVGSGAFMGSMDRARKLARTIIDIGQGAGKKVSVIISDMNQPLGCAVGNANELREAIEVLQGGGPEDVWELTRELGAEMLLVADMETDVGQARKRLSRARDSGAGLQRLQRCIELQGGDPRVAEDPDRLPRWSGERAVHAEQAGWIRRIDARKIGLAAMALGAGRHRVEDPVDHAVGLTFSVRLGQRVEPGLPLATLQFNDSRRAVAAERLVREAICIADERDDVPPLVHEVLRRSGDGTEN